MVCPQCLAEYSSGTNECPVCFSAPIYGPPAPESPSGDLPDAIELDADVDFDVLIRSGFKNLVAIGLARGLLHEAGIPFFAMDQNVAARQESGNIFGWWTIRVQQEREAEAREILESVEAMK